MWAQCARRNAGNCQSSGRSSTSFSYPAIASGQFSDSNASLAATRSARIEASSPGAADWDRPEEKRETEREHHAHSEDHRGYE